MGALNGMLLALLLAAAGALTLAAVLAKLAAVRRPLAGGVA